VFTWWVEADARARRAFVAASFGWMLDSFDVMLYSIVVAELVKDPTLHLSLQTAGILNSVTLVAAAVGGIAFGVVADRIGRKRALIAAVLIYSVFTAACGFAQSALQLALFRICLGLGMGGEWATWAIGYGLAALVNLVAMPLWGWRGVFFVGVLPALFTVWIQQRVEEPAIWKSAATAERGRLSAIFDPSIVAVTLAVTFMNACCLFGWWGLNAWVPAYLRLSPAQGGVGLSSEAMSLFVIAMQVGMWFGYVSFGFIADAVGRKTAYVTFVAVAAVLLPLYGAMRTPSALLVLGPFVAFFGTGYYSGLGAIVAEIYPTAVRATAAGFTYNFGRLASAAAPLTIGRVAETSGFGPAFTITGAAFLLAAASWMFIPNTQNRELI